MRSGVAVDLSTPLSKFLEMTFSFQVAVLFAVCCFLLFSIVAQAARHARELFVHLFIWRVQIDLSATVICTQGVNTRDASISVRDAFYTKHSILRFCSLFMNPIIFSTH